MKYREKSEIIEAVKWDGKLETIENNEWLEDALKDEKIIIATDKLTDKECTMLMREFRDSYNKVELGEYIVRLEREKGYKMKHIKAEEFEQIFEPLPEEIHGYTDWAGRPDGHRNGTCMYTGTTGNKKVERLG